MPLAIAPVQTRGAVCASRSAPGCAWQRRCAALQVESGAVPEGERRTGAGLTPFLPASHSSRTAARPLRATDPGVESFRSSEGPAQPAFLDILPFPPSAPSPCSLQKSSARSRCVHSGSVTFLTKRAWRKYLSPPSSDRRGLPLLQTASLPGLPAGKGSLSPATQAQGTWEGPDEPLLLQLTEMALNTDRTHWEMHSCPLGGAIQSFTDLNNKPTQPFHHSSRSNTHRSCYPNASLEV